MQKMTSEKYIIYQKLRFIILNLSSKPEYFHNFGRTVLEAAMMGKKIAGYLDRGGTGYSRLIPVLLLKLLDYFP